MFLSGYVACGRAESTDCLYGFWWYFIFIVIIHVVIAIFYFVTYFISVFTKEKFILFIIYSELSRYLKKQDGLSFLYSGLLHHQRLNWINE